MQGNGTKEKPYIITTVNDLYSMSELGGIDVYFELGNDIDLNGTEYGETFAPIPLKCAVFDGKNYAIRNIYKNAPTVDLYVFEAGISGTMSMKNLLLDNVTLLGYSVSCIKAASEVKCTVNMYNCTLLLNVKRCSTTTPSSSSPTGTCIMHGVNVVVNTELCSIAVKGDFLSPFPFFRNGRVYRTQVIVDLCMRFLYPHNGYDSAIFSSVDVDDSWISGSIKSIDKTSGSKIMYMANTSVKFNNFFHTVVYENIPTMHWDGKFIGCFYDADAVGSAVYGGSANGCENFKALTTDQCRDAEYLKTIGFVCEGGNE